ncbi:MAG: hypothetical protein DLM53_03680 [Candidatus Eremiobacter antarcticus]|nr:hypothetical protein [Candidatus Eremiobacteraeota bacterium]MBC5807373.1 hypothetical protein [Candidatus Eremiobacteraeota bacterium]PZR63125.1 MAG: hypothetical protein DLM53_03680 [Candidatus Eremiobacter sp. RRmetagenome_bin22]
MGARVWADDLLEFIKEDFHGHQQSRNRVSIEDHTFISVRMNGELVEVQVGDLDSAAVDFQPFEFNPATTSINDAARSLQPFIRCMQWLQS